MAARGCTTSATTSCRTGSWSGWITAIRCCRRSTRCSGSRPIRPCASISRAAAASATARGRLSEGGLQSIPKLTFPGGALVGDAAGFLNVPKIKGTHAAMKSGMLAAEAVAEALADDRPAEPTAFEDRFRDSWLHDELRQRPQHPPGLRPFRPLRRHRLFGGRYLRAARQARPGRSSTRMPTMRALPAAAAPRRSSIRSRTAS